MTVSQEPAAGQRDDGREDRFRRNPLLHLGACLTIGTLIILMILAIHWRG
jgi:hypothetical protein